MVDAWPATVGAPIARNAWPARIARDGTVHVNTADSIWAFELAHRAGEIAERLGVPKVRFAPGPLADRSERDPRPEPPRPTQEQETAAREIAAGIADANLRESVQKAVSFSLARAHSDSEV